MLDHIGVDVSDIAKSRAFYEAALKPLGYRVIQELGPEQGADHPIVMFGIEAPEFVIAEGVLLEPDAKDAAMAGARASIDALAA